MQHLSLTGARDKIGLLLSVVALGLPEKQETQTRFYLLSTIGKNVVWLNQETHKNGLWRSGEFGKTI